MSEESNRRKSIREKMGEEFMKRMEAVVGVKSGVEPEKKKEKKPMKFAINDSGDDVFIPPVPAHLSKLKSQLPPPVPPPLPSTSCQPVTAMAAPQIQYIPQPQSFVLPSMFREPIVCPLCQRKKFAICK